MKTYFKDNLNLKGQGYTYVYGWTGNNVEANPKSYIIIHLHFNGKQYYGKVRDNRSAQLSLQGGLRVYIFYSEILSIALNTEYIFIFFNIAETRIFYLNFVYIMYIVTLQ